MSISNDIESLFQALRAKVGTFTSDTEAHFTNFLHLAKSEEAAAEARVQAEIEHMQSLGYSVEKAPSAPEPVATTAVAAAGADVAAPAAEQPAPTARGRSASASNS
jgi:DNA-binding protein H-NS